jgi:hypothetical protein
MDTTHKDFIFLKNLLTEFVSQPHLIRRFQIMKETKISGWEIWFQIELAIFLQQHEDVADWERESRHSIDKRKVDWRNNISIDFYIRQRCAHGLIPLEIKQNEVAKQCIKNMIEDINKFRKIKPSSHKTNREPWCLGIHNKVNEKTIRDYLTDYDLIYNENYFWIHEIPNTEYMITLF